MAAEQKAVESTAAAQERDQESQEQAQEVLKEYLKATDRAGYSQRALREGLLEKTASVQGGASAKDRKEEVSARVVRSEATDHVDHSQRVLTDHADRSGRTANVRGEASERALREGLLATESHLEEREEVADSEIRQRRVSQEETSTISVTSRKAE